MKRQDEMTNTITCKIQNAKSIMRLFRGETVRLPRKKKKQQKKLLRGSLPQGQNNLLHYPKTSSTFIFYWHKNKIKMKTLGKMTMAIKAQGASPISTKGGVKNEDTP